MYLKRQESGDYVMTNRLIYNQDKSKFTYVSRIDYKYLTSFQWSMDDYVESRYNELEALSLYRGEYDEKDD